MNAYRLVLLGLVAAFPLTVQAAQEGAAGKVHGVVTAKGQRTNADVVVSLHAPGLTGTPPGAPVEMDQAGMLFVPRVLPVVTGTTVRFLNSDPLPHNVFSPQGKYNLGTWPKGEVRDYTFEKPGVYAQLCRVHPEMEAFIVVLDTPYFAVTDRTGRFEISGVPPGEYSLVTWGGRLKESRQRVTVDTGGASEVNLTLTR